MTSQTASIIASIISPNPTAIAVIARGVVLSRLALCDLNRKDLTPAQYTYKFTNHSLNALLLELDFPQTLLPGLSFSPEFPGSSHRGAIFSFSLALILILLFISFEGKIKQSIWRKHCGDMKKMASRTKQQPKFVFREELGIYQYAHIDKFLLKPVLFMSPFWCDVAS